MVLGFLFFSLIMPEVVLPSLETKDTTSLYDGWTVTLIANGPVEVLAYSTDSASGASLFDENGDEVLKTVPENVPGAFAAKSVLRAGRYTLKGNATTFVFSGEGFVGFESPDMNRSYRIFGALLGIMYVLLLAIVLFLYIRSGLFTQNK